MTVFGFTIDTYNRIIVRDGTNMSRDIVSLLLLATIIILFIIRWK